MIFHSVAAACYVTQSFRWIGGAERGYETAGGRRHGCREADVSFHDFAREFVSSSMYLERVIFGFENVNTGILKILPVDVHWILVPKRRLADQKLV